MTIHPACLKCRGACCEYVKVERCHMTEPAWWALHGIQNSDGSVFLDVRCRALTSAGRCINYESRPLPCRVMPVGGGDCLESIRFRRNPKLAGKIIELATAR